MSMNRSVLVSAAGHIAVVVVGYFGLPLLREPLDLTESAMVVEIVTVADTTNVPSQPQPPKPEPKPVETVQPEPPKPPPPVPVAAPPPTPVAAPPPPQVAVLPPDPKPEPLPTPKAKPEPPPEPKPQPKVEAPPPKPQPKPVVEAKPEKKPQEADPFASVLKTVENLKKSTPPDTKPDPKAKPEPKPTPFEDQIAKALSKSPQVFDPTRQLSMSEIDLVKRQISDCWNVPAGAKDAQDLNVVLEVEVNRDGTVRTADIKDGLRSMSDPFYRAAAESAKRAMFNPKCTPLRLPPDRYEHWRSMIITFNPKEMFGT